MRKRLYILRHAKATPAAVAEGDHARPLDAHGCEEAASLATWLHAQAEQPQQVLCSTSERTRGTLAALTLDAPVAYSDRLYLASGREMLALIQATSPATERLLLVCHNAGAHELVALLTGDGSDADLDRLQHGFPTCALAILGFEGAWNDLRPGQCHLDTLRYPGH